MTGLRLNNKEHDGVNISTAFQSSVNGRMGKSGKTMANCHFSNIKESKAASHLSKKGEFLNYC